MKVIVRVKGGSEFEKGLAAVRRMNGKFNSRTKEWTVEVHPGFNAGANGLIEVRRETPTTPKVLTDAVNRTKANTDAAHNRLEAIGKQFGANSPEYSDAFFAFECELHTVENALDDIEQYHASMYDL